MVPVGRHLNFFVVLLGNFMNYQLLRCLLNYSRDGDVQGAVQGQYNGPGAGGDQGGEYNSKSKAPYQH